jgi:hypothetical protein
MIEEIYKNPSQTILVNHIYAMNLFKGTSKFALLDICTESVLIKRGYFGKAYSKDIYFSSKLEDNALYFTCKKIKYKKTGIKRLKISDFTHFDYSAIKTAQVNLSLIMCEKFTGKYEDVFILLNNNDFVAEFTDHIDPMLIKDFPELIGNASILL